MDGLIFALLGALGAALLGWIRSRRADFLAQRPRDYAGDGGPRFDARAHLNGPIACEGVIFGPTGRVSSRFAGEIDCRWDGDAGVMDEVFTYGDGSRQARSWRLAVGDDGRILARADDVVGEGTGRQAGGSMQLKYRIRLPEAQGGHVLDAVDWMYLAPGGTIINRSQFRKHGIRVAELVATMRPARGGPGEAA